MAKNRNKIQLSDNFTYSKLLRFTYPSMIMMLFTSIYSVVDGIFISNFAGETAFAAVNFIFPYLMLFSAVGFMIGTGGCALVSRLLGSGSNEHARQVFSTLVYLALILGAVFAAVGEVTLEPVAKLLRAEGEMLEICIRYGRIFLITMPAFMLQFTFQSFLVTAERPKLGLLFTVCAGVTNIILDALFVGLFRWGVVGAAAATCIGQCIGGIGPFIYFCAPNSSLLHLGRANWSIRDIGKAASNGLAEFLSNISFAIVNMAYNFQLLRMAGEYGVSAYGIIMYLGFVFSAVYLGYSMGISPVVGFHYGAGDKDELRSLLRKSLVFIGCAALILTALAEIFSGTLAGIFAGYDEEFLALSKRALRLYSLCYLISGFNIFTSAFFAALNHGPVSATLSFSRVFVFELSCVFVVPLIFKIDGVWLAISFAELLALCFSAMFLAKYKKKIGY